MTTLFRYKIEGTFNADSSIEAWNKLVKLTEELERYTPNHPKPKFQLLKSNARVFPKNLFIDNSSRRPGEGEEI